MRTVTSAQETGSNTLSLPCSYRTVAEEYTAGQYSYTHDGHGGLSWGIPYCAGVMALGWQVDPTPDGRGNDAVPALHRRHRHRWQPHH